MASQAATADADRDNLMFAKFADVERIVEPVPPSGGMCVIRYPPEYKTLMEIFRGLMKSGELSERVLELTADILEWNAAHYTVWVIRRDCLRALDAEHPNIWEEERRYADAVSSENPKNYQIWHHRRVILEKLDSIEAAREELLFYDEMLESDAKNYHVWANRLWVLKTFRCWERELEYCEKLIDEDWWNNSAWNHRHNVVRHAEEVTDAIAVREIAYAMEKAALGYQNESPWTYALSFARSHDKAEIALREACDALLDVIEDGVEPALSAPEDRQCPRFIRLELDVKKGDVESLRKAADAADLLANEEDAFRVRYWSVRAHDIRNAVKKLTGETPILPHPGFPEVPEVRVAYPEGVDPPVAPRHKLATDDWDIDRTPRLLYHQDRPGYVDSDDDDDDDEEDDESSEAKTTVGGEGGILPAAESAAPS